MARQAAQGQSEAPRQKHERQRSHEGDTEIRLPGSLDEPKPAPIKRNMTTYQLPRTNSNVKLKKNLSHGQLSRLGSGKNLAALAQKAPPSPALKGRQKRSKSEQMTALETAMETGKDLRQQEVELAEQQRERKDSSKKVGFAVGSSNETSDGEEEAPQMEGSGLDEGEWTEESASASPYSTRQNTANNSRRPSAAHEKPPDRVAIANIFRAKETQQPSELKAKIQEQRPEEQTEADGTPAASCESGSDGDSESDSDNPPSPKSQPQHLVHAVHEAAVPPEPAKPDELEQPAAKPEPQPLTQQPAQSEGSQPQRSEIHAAKAYANPTAKFLGGQGLRLPAPARVDQSIALDEAHSARPSPAPSIKSSRSIGGDGAADQPEGELVSRFIPSASHPSTGSGGNTGTMNTPRHGSFQTPEEDCTLAAQHRDTPGFQLGPTSPGSTVSGSSGAATPAQGRSRIELKMMQEKAAAEREFAAERQPIVPPHVYDRRNESVKSYLYLAQLGANGKGGLHSTNGLSLGPEIFQGRFKAVNTELKVVQKYRNPIAESIERLKRCKGSKLNMRSSPQKQQMAALRLSKSAVSLPSRQPGVVKQPSNLSTSASPPKMSVSPVKPALASGKSSVQVGSEPAKRSQQRGVSFAGTPPQTHQYQKSEDELDPDAIARRLWDSVGI